MADLKITQLVDGGAPQATDEFVIARAGDNFKVDYASLEAAGLAGAVILAPASSARNVIQPTAGAVIALTLDTVSPVEDYEWVLKLTGVEGDMGGFDSAGGLSLIFRDPDAALIIDGDAAQIGPMFQAVGHLPGSTARYSGIDHNSRLFTGNADVPADAEIYGPGYLTFWFDPTNGAAFLRGKAKTLDGTVVTFSLPISNGTAYVTGGTDVAVADGGTGASTATAARTNLDVPSNAEAVLDTLFDANTVLAANTDDTPAALTMGASTILARLAAGNIKAASVAEIVTLLNAYVVGGTDVAVADGGTGASTAAAARANLAVPPSRILKAGRYYNCLPDPVADGTFAPTADQVVYTPFPVATGFTADRISLGVAVAGTAGAKVRLGIYNDDGTGQPGTLLLDAGVINGDSATYQEITISQALTGGTLYWTAVCWQVASVGAGTVRGSGVANGGAWWVGKVANSTDVRTANYKQAGVTGAFGTATPSTTAAEVGNPNVRVRAA